MDILVYLYRTVDLFLSVLNLALIAYVILSWFPGAMRTPLGYWVIRIVSPILRPFRNLRLQFLGLDWTVFVVIILLDILHRYLPVLFFSW
ncbi:MULTISPECIES: YggT family protein [unclassified Streptococcus]|uniref:YggT family protein n=1 Tax=unclassified Streptococcus TaxID=2608887 RepID=UPI0018AABF6C|nr:MULTISPECIES: YggT family protein [unclassified Streptococcus]MBF8970390.1 YggT family protein [Streptococcus sp. NLN76]MBJ6744988.1 YggT family protein [Streptococcus sp. 121]